MLWDPSEEEEVLQNVQSISVLAQGSQPLARELGVPIDLLDGPLPVAQARIAAALSAQISEYEPRATVASVSVAADADGNLTPTVRLA